MSAHNAEADAQAQQGERNKPYKNNMKFSVKPFLKGLWGFGQSHE